MVSSFISLLLLSLFKICGQTFFYNDIDKKKIIETKINDSGISVEKQNEIRNAAVKMAKSIIELYIKDYNKNELESLCKINPYPYSELLGDFIIRISNRPLTWRKCLKWLDYYFIEFELKNEIEGFEEFVKKQSDFILCTKSLLHLLSELIEFPKEMFPRIWEDV